MSKEGKIQIAWDRDGGFTTCDHYIRVQIQKAENSKYFNWWQQNGGSIQSHKATQHFVETYDNFYVDSCIDDSTIVARAENIIHGSKTELAELFLKSPCDDPQEFFVKVNELRAIAGVDLVRPDMLLLRKMEAAQIKEQSSTFRPSVQKLIKMGFTIDEIRYSKDMEEMLQKYMLRNPNLKLEETEEEFANTYFEALDYLERHNRLMLIKLQNSTPSQLKKFSQKREQDRQLMYDCGFTDEDILAHKSLIRKLENDPKTIKKVYRMLQNSGVITDHTPLNTDDRKSFDKAKKSIKDHYPMIKGVAKGAFWCLACCGDISFKTINVLSGKKPRKSIFTRYVRKGPDTLFKAYKKEKKQAQSAQAKKVRELKQNAKLSKQRENEYLRHRVAKDIKLANVKTVFSKAS